MILTEQNYFSIKANKTYFGVSQIKDFYKCEAMAMAKLTGQYVQEKTSALLVGSYVDAHFSNELHLFKAQNPEIFTAKGELKSEYRKADEIIARIERDELFMNYLNGEKQVIQTGFINGFAFKVKHDVLQKDCIVDLKIMRDMEDIWQCGEKKSFVEAWQYDLQGAVYQDIEAQNRGEFALPKPFILAVATKESATDIALLGINQQQLDYKMEELIDRLPRINAVKTGKLEAVRCECCDYCRQTKKLTKVIDYTEINGEE
jgi:hypothetical protein